MRKAILISILAASAAFAQQSNVGNQQAPAGAAQEKRAASKAKILTSTELDQLLAVPGKILLIDVRRPDEISSKGGFPVYLSIQVDQLEKYLAEIPKDRLLVTVSNHAGRAGRAADLLASKGFQVAGAVGAQTYESEGGKLQKIEIAKTAN